MKKTTQNQKLTRKQQRKQNRIAKKAKKNDFFAKKKSRHNFEKQNKTNGDNNFASKKYKPQLQKQASNKEENYKTNTKLATKYSLSEKTKEKKKLSKKIGNYATNANSLSLADETLRMIKGEQLKSKQLQIEMNKSRQKHLKINSSIDDIEIKKLEKQLGISKKGGRDISKLFASDGLDYLLDVCDNNSFDDVDSKKRLYESDDDFVDDLAKITGDVSKTQKRKRSDSTISKKKIKADDDGSDSEPEEVSSLKCAVRSQKSPKAVESGDERDQELSSEDDDLDSLIDSEEGADESPKMEETLTRKSLHKVVDPKKKHLCDSKNKKSKELSHLELDVSENDSIDGLLSCDEPTGDMGPDDGEYESDEMLDDDGGTESDKINDKGAAECEVTGTDGRGENRPGGNMEDKAVKRRKADGDGTWEDIYGRTRDKEGNVVTKYQPPQLRNQLENSSDDEKLQRLQKQMKGLLNRLAENNMVSISTQIETLYGQHSRNDMNETMWKLFEDSLIVETQTPERLVAEHALLLAALSANVGAEVAAHSLQRAIALWHRLSTAHPSVPDKRTNNLLLLLSFMCHLKLFHCTLIYDILYDILSDNVNEKAVELVLVVLRTVGFTLRKDDPVRLKDFVLKTQMLANNTSVDHGSRAKFLLETVMAIKNNNMSKIPNYNAEYGEQLKKTLKACIRKGNYNAELKITLEDLLKADERGRWWVVGSAWTGVLPGEKPPEESSSVKVSSQEQGFSNKLLELAKSQRMNTDTRRSIFCVLMSAEDYIDAFEKVLKLRLRGPSEREVMNVLLHCLLQERNYNPYYEHVARKFCVANRRFQIMLQYASWDKIQGIGSLTSSQVTNFAKFLGNLIVQKNLPISVLKVVELGGLDKASMRFMRQVLLTIMLTDSEEEMLAVFARVAASKPLKMFRESLRLFLHHFVLRNAKTTEDAQLLTARVKMADMALSAADRGPAF